MADILTIPALQIEPGDSLGEGLLVERVALTVDTEGDEPPDGRVYVFLKRSAGPGGEGEAPTVDPTRLPDAMTYVFCSHHVPVTVMRPQD